MTRDRTLDLTLLVEYITGECVVNNNDASYRTLDLTLLVEYITVECVVNNNVASYRTLDLTLLVDTARKRT